MKSETHKNERIGLLGYYDKGSPYGYLTLGIWPFDYHQMKCALCKNSTPQQRLNERKSRRPSAHWYALWYYLHPINISSVGHVQGLVRHLQEMTIPCIRVKTILLDYLATDWQSTSEEHPTCKI